MSTLITICSYNALDAKSILLKSRLESEGIPCYIKNEFAKFRRGGGRTELQISSADYELAIPILKETGFYDEERIEIAPFLVSFNNVTKHIPVLKDLSLEMRLLLITIIVVSAISTVIYFYLQNHPSNNPTGF